MLSPVAPMKSLPSVKNRLPVQRRGARRRSRTGGSSSSLLALVLVFVTGLAALVRHPTHAAQPTLQWGMFELSLKAGPKLEGLNPYQDVNFSAWFFQDGPAREVVGFYDGNGTFRVRFMPSRPGTWHYTTISSLASLEGHNGEFMVTAPSVKSPTGSSAPVGITSASHFAYADGRAYEPRGTTAAVATLEDDAHHGKTLRMLKEGAFNKVRLSVLPRSTEWPHAGPPLYPFEGKPHHFDVRRFNPAYFQRLERWIAELQRSGIEADVILFHGEDGARWGLDQLSAEDQDRYLRYVIARLAAFRNVWWSVANEFDRLKSPGAGDFERLGNLIVARDPYHHLLSIQSGGPLFDYRRPWLTHVSLSAEAAAAGPGHAAVSPQTYGKPVVIDPSH